MGELFKDKEHLVRAAALLAAGLVGFLLLRGLLIPADFGELGHYRASALIDNAEIPLRYAGRAVCEECHDGVAEERAGGAHQGVGCEACHGALALHAEDPEALVPELPAVSSLCVSCHRAGAAKPDWFPTVEPDVHAEGEACDECHMPHAPGI